MILSVRTGFPCILLITECQQKNDCDSKKYFNPKILYFTYILVGYKIIELKF